MDESRRTRLRMWRMPPGSEAPTADESELQHAHAVGQSKRAADDATVIFHVSIDRNGAISKFASINMKEARVGDFAIVHQHVLDTMKDLIPMCLQDLTNYEAMGMTGDKDEAE